MKMLLRSFLFFLVDKEGLIAFVYFSLLKYVTMGVFLQFALISYKIALMDLMKIYLRQTHVHQINNIFFLSVVNKNVKNEQKKK